MNNVNLNNSLSFVILLSPVAFMLMYLLDGYFDPIGEPVASIAGFATAFILTVFLLGVGYVAATNTTRPEGEEIPLGNQVFRLCVLLLLMSAIALHYGKSEKTPETECYYCRETVNQWIESKYGKAVCTECLGEENYTFCADCGDAYCPWEDGGDKWYCDNCRINHEWYCLACENLYLLDSLYDGGNGYYICADCIVSFMETGGKFDREIFDNAMEQVSNIVSRDEYFSDMDG